MANQDYWIFFPLLPDPKITPITDEQLLRYLFCHLEKRSIAIELFNNTNKYPSAFSIQVTPAGLADEGMMLYTTRLHILRSLKRGLKMPLTRPSFHLDSIMISCADEELGFIDGTERERWGNLRLVRVYDADS